jgi:integrase
VQRTNRIIPLPLLYWEPDGCARRRLRGPSKEQLADNSYRSCRQKSTRYTFASHLIIDLKLDVAHVSRILGHARPSITLDTYTHLFHHAAHAADIRQRMATSDFGALLANTDGNPTR